ncbi:MAG: TonB family protein [Rhodocyclaceae bacterium]|nr:TonB family protein [Rhodocyclaceae bacterium]
MLPTSVSFAVALGVSLFIHAVVLAVHFKLPEALGKATEQALDVILVNSKSATKPHHAQARAQANLDGGGNTDENRRAATPLPLAKLTRDGDAALEAQRRVAALEAEQRQMLTRLNSETAVAAATRRADPTPPAPLPNLSGADLASSAMNMVRLEAEINRNLDEYNKRPRKAFIGARTAEYRFAQYVEDWRQKMERIGNLNYPEAARGKLYGSLVLSVTIRADGSVKQILIDRGSGHRVLDDAARRIVELAAPYAPFPPNIARDTDEIEISRTWSFTSADRLQSN